jgi:phospholipase C
VRLLLVAAVLGLGCGNTAPPPAEPPPVVTDDEARALREACTFKKGALPSQTLSTTSRLGAQIPIEHIVLVMQENRSFDHYFSNLTHGGVRVAPRDASNPDLDGMPVERFHMQKYCVRDPDHSWAASHAQFDDGKMDGFVRTNGADGARAIGYYDDTDLPYYYALARTFAISDAHFASVMGPTQPNRLYYWAATSYGTIANTLPPLKDASGKPYPNLFTRLNDAHVSWKVYAKLVASPAVFIDLLAKQLDHFRPLDEYFTDLGDGTLPQVAIVEAAFTEGTEVEESDEHPSANLQVGQLFTQKVVNATIASSTWAKTALFLTYDEHGGFYDSVPPGKACRPDELDPIGDDTRKFDHYGFRVPLIAISPYARRGYVSHVVSDHTSVIRFVSARFDLPAITARDANADALLDLFDFGHPVLEVPPLAEALVDQDRRAQCLADFP